MKEKKLSLKELLLNKRMMICLFNGFSSGLPLYFLSQLVPAWLRDSGVDLKTIGFFSIVFLPFSFKYLWAPFLDRYIPPFLGRRRGWMLISQFLLLGSMCLLALLDPRIDERIVLYVGLMVGFFSASQDVVLDAYRRELLPDEELGLGNSYYANAYRLSGFIPGGLGLILADFMPWPMVFIIISLFMLVGVLQTLFIREVEQDIEPPKSLREAVVEPFKDFFQRDGFKTGLLILAFIFFYKFGDVVATALSTPFYIDLGFSMSVIGTVAKVVGLWSMIIGGFIGGLVMYRVGINKSLWLFGFIQMATILGFAALSEIGANVYALGVVVAFEYLGVGLGSAALMAFIASCTNKNFTATQLALLTSLFSIPKIFAGLLAGVLIEGVSPTDGVFYSIFGAVGGIGYTHFFFICTLLAVPGMVLLFWVAPWGQRREADEKQLVDGDGEAN
ncbi:PAT family beta-lactamase induction signal transducer AmpG [Sinobacterium caligoides]|uniref:PAT family beta-lactamase induction signal transducer AmpG n=1 Tax=Sinobacterium caligoides TaxID=933926 RepID=A0A3N2DND5_9GAMM|nr:AmpG family muropeptide MFS transporter [Sinobacterium caligoides]ROS01280.1 PAT family beta-lactamase induction signal transducer AmpG [Sinobacterium caligoides]